MERYEINKYMDTFKDKISDLFQALQIENKREKVKELNDIISDPYFWQKDTNHQQIIGEANNLKEDINLYDNVETKYKDLVDLVELSHEDEEALILLEDEILNFVSILDEAEQRALLSDKYDGFNAIVELHPGAGGTESMDWASMLYRMYQRYCQKKGFSLTILDYQAGDEAGIKSITFLVKGKFAYGLFKSERGVHRLVRISPFDSGGRRHTSFCSCDVAPELGDSDEIIIKDEEVRIDVYHSQGAGGQSVNTTDSAVRLTHLPTGIVVTCQNERSQIKNKEVAFRILKAKLLEKQLEEKREEINKLKGIQQSINFGSQIRSYVFCPYTLVKDHRTQEETNNVDDVMDGNIDNFVYSYLKYERKNNEN